MTAPNQPDQAPRRTPDAPPGGLTLGNGLDLMRSLPDASVDALVTDPPYGNTALAFDQTAVDWPAWWSEAHRVTKPTGPIVCFAADLFTVDLIQSNRAHYRYRLVWCKTMPTGFLDANRRPLRAHEDVLVFAQRMKGSTYNPQRWEAGYLQSTRAKRTQSHYGKVADEAAQQARTTDRHPTTVLQFGSQPTTGRLHPTQKPVDLMKWLVSTYTNPGDTVLDPFAGSGSTGVAALELERRFIGAELDPAYHAIAAERLLAAQPNMLGVY